MSTRHSDDQSDDEDPVVAMPEGEKGTTNGPP